MNKLLLVAVVSLFLIQCGRADENAHRKLAEELLGLMDVAKNTEQVMESIKQMQMAQLKSMDISPAASEKVRSMQSEMSDLMAKELTWANLKEDYVSMYAETFTAEELEGIIDFYKSPAGQAFIQKTPEMMNKSMAIVQKQMERIGPKIQEMTQKLTGEIQPTQKATP